MLKLNEKYDIKGKFLKCDFIGYFPLKKSTINTGISQIYFKVPREDSVMSVKMLY